MPFTQSPISFAAGDVCSFAVRLENVGGGQTLTIFANGVVRFTGSLWTRVTNLDTGASITVNSSGPGTITPNSDETLTLKATGHSLFFFFPGDLGTGRDGAILWTTGLVVERVSGDFSEIISFSHPHGTTEDLCQILE